MRLVFFLALTAQLSLVICNTEDLTDQDVIVETKVLPKGMRRVVMVVKDGELVEEEEDEEGPEKVAVKPPPQPKEPRPIGKETNVILQGGGKGPRREGTRRVVMVVKDGELVEEDEEEEDNEEEPHPVKETRSTAFAPPLSEENQAVAGSQLEDDLSPPTPVGEEVDEVDEPIQVSAEPESKPPAAGGGMMMKFLRKSMHKRMLEKEATRNELAAVVPQLTVEVLGATAERAALLGALESAKLGHTNSNSTNDAPEATSGALGGEGDPPSVHLYDGIALRFGFDRSSSLAFTALAYLPVDAVLISSALAYAAGAGFGVGFAAYALRSF